MDTKISAINLGADSLKLPPAIRQGVREFAREVMEMYGESLVSVSVFGSAVTGDYDEGESDVNLMVVYSDLEIADLARVSELSRRWLKKQRLAPRFLSHRNLTESARYFQIDFLDMRDAHVTLCGEDILSGIELDRRHLRWQIAYEVKAMRMRIKQLFWRAAGEDRTMKAVLVGRFTSLLHVIRALLLLKGLEAPITRSAIIVAAADHLGLDRGMAERLLHLRRSPPPDPRVLMEMFSGLMEMIRLTDARVEEEQE